MRRQSGVYPYIHACIPRVRGSRESHSNPYSHTYTHTHVYKHCTNNVSIHIVVCMSSCVYIWQYVCQLGRCMPIRRQGGVYPYLHAYKPRVRGRESHSYPRLVCGREKINTKKIHTESSWKPREPFISTSSLRKRARMDIERSSSDLNCVVCMCVCMYVNVCMLCIHIYKRARIDIERPSSDLNCVVCM